jgi:A/G-specific adenine glycosylase
MLPTAALPRFRKNLLTWFAHSQRDLPWRRSKDPYRIWLSEIMLQQTRVAAAVPYYERFLANFPTIQSLASAPQQDVLRLWSGLGYYSRARNLQSAAQLIVARHNSTFPEDHRAVLALPGIGKYTSAAILSIAHDQKLAVLDGNVARVIARLLAIRGDLRTTNRWQELQTVAGKLLAPSSPGDWNQAMMELGAIVCTPRSPQCLLCPVNQFCQARKQGLIEVIPEKRKRRATVEITLACVIFRDPQGRTLLFPPTKKSPETTQPNNIPALLSHLWHFPTIQVHSTQIHPAQVRPNQAAQSRQPAVSVDDAITQLRHHLESLLKTRRSILELTPLKKISHTVTFRKITLLPFLAKVRKLPTLPHIKSKSLPLSNLSSVPISNLTRKAGSSLSRLVSNP